jgi:hypothetical protein
LLPKKTTPQEWVDVVLPVFDQPEEKAPRERSKAQQEKDAGIRYARYRSPVKASCIECVHDHMRTGGQIRQAAYIRTEGEDAAYLCFPHYAERRNRELLGRPDEPR